MTQAIDRLLDQLAVADPASDEALLHDLMGHCRRAATAWPVVLTAGGGQIDRRAAILSGPSFTSDRHPWPSIEGLWLEPALQIDLQVLQMLGGVPLGDGWLQVWMAQAEGVTRVVPRNDVAAHPLSPPPSLDAAAYHQRLRLPDDTGRPAWRDDGYAITGFADPYFEYGTNELRGYIEAAMEELVLSPLLRDAMLAVLRAVGDDPNVYRGGHRAFGAVRESELTAISVPPVVFVLDEAAPLLESANANDGIYVCYERGAADDIVFSVNSWFLNG